MGTHRPDSDTTEQAASILFRQYVPSRPLADFVELFWYWRGHDRPRSTERVLPMGTMELVIDLGAVRGPVGGISGPHSAAFLIERTARDELLGIHFRPAGAFPFLRCAAGELHNRYATLDELWGEAASERLLSRLHDAGSIDAKFRVFEQWLTGVAALPLVRHAAVAYALGEFQRHSAVQSAGQVARAVNLSQRRFIQVFRDQVGLAPKLYCRIGRFQRILAQVAHASDPDWADVALGCGYFDQSHFIHDFREFTGLRPTEYLGLRIAGQTNHVRVLG